MLAMDLLSAGGRYMIWTHRGDVTCVKFPNVTVPLAVPAFPKFTFVGATTIHGAPAHHFRLNTPTGAAPIGAYFDPSTGAIMQLTNQEEMLQVQTTTSFVPGQPDVEKYFAVPEHCEAATHSVAPSLPTLLTPETQRGSVGARRWKAPPALVVAAAQAAAANPDTPGFGGVSWKQARSASLQQSHTAPKDPRRLQADTRATVPASVDWRAAGMVTVARDQGNCGSCWAFSSAAALETAAAVAQNRTVSPAAHLSVQELLDCVDLGDSTITVKACFGGWPPAALAYGAKSGPSGGLAPENAYPYRAVSGAECGAGDTAAREGGEPAGVTFVEAREDPAAMEAMVAKYGAVVVVINVLPDFIVYTGGVYDNPACTRESFIFSPAVCGVLRLRVRLSGDFDDFTSCLDQLAPQPPNIRLMAPTHPLLSLQRLCSML